MAQHDHEADLDRARRQAHEQGRQQGRAEALPFTGAAGVRFPATLPVHQAVLRYERLLMEADPDVRRHAADPDALDPDADSALEGRLQEVAQELASTKRRGPIGTPWSWVQRRLARRELERQHGEFVERIDQLAARREQARYDVVSLEEELAAVQAWLDQWVDDAAAYAPDRRWLRRPLSEPPSWVQTYPSSADFIAEDPRRAARNERPHDTGGQDYGMRWTWTDPAVPGAKPKRWRVSWLRETGEVYAVRRAAADNRESWAGGHDDPEPVWLLASLPCTRLGERADRAVEKHLTSLERLHSTPRESLLALVDAVGATDWEKVLPGEAAAD